MHSNLSPSGMTEWLSSWGYRGIFICIFMGNLGIPVPEELVLVVAGALAGRKDLDLATLYVVAILSAVTGDSCGFLAGRTGGQQVFEWLAGKFHFVRRRYQHLQTFFQAHGNSAVFLARFVMGARFMAGPMAGAAGMPFWSFLGWNLLGACVWCFLVITLGYFVGNQLDWVVHLVEEGGHWIAVAVFLAVVVTVCLLWRRKGHHQKHLS
jgi:membrane protein DedA with SNARE-associated domain